MIEKRDYWLWLTRVKGISKGDIAELLKWVSSVKELFDLDEKILRGEIFKSHKFRVSVDDFIRSRDCKNIEKYKKELWDKGINYVSIDDDDYPYSLYCLYDKAYLLYYKGTLKRHGLNIAIVGARRCTRYASNIAFKFAKDLAENGVNIISGLAYGVDSRSHLGALEAGGFTTAVVGCGFDYCYPSENKDLLKRISQNGLVFSEYHPNIRPTTFTFPLRNRIISGLSDGVLLVEARKKSGSLITINHALEIGRDIFAVPLDVMGKSNEGGNQVIRDGGKVVFNYEDILETYPLFLERIKLRNELFRGLTCDKQVKTSMKVLLEKDESRVYDAIAYYPLGIEDLVDRLEIGINDLQFILLKLEMKGLIKILSNKRYLRND